ncbi:MAG: hypothetical protein A3J60_02230 [Candidatus Pacebacteria bacterium RIFCSPHIGHO2_02_FULL_46_9]|nr:MAG: hypothetical protein A3J60_02230 [Candidatus Pacebacteria bacterium RIFCSPHIGHO2_02_FULL_46_9]
MFIAIQEYLAEFVQYVQYKVLRAKYSFPLPHSIDFDTKIDKRNKTLLISSPKHPGLYVIAPLGDDQTTIDLVNDAIFTYFDVPRYIARNTENHFFPGSIKPGKKTKFVYPKGLAFA